MRHSAMCICSQQNIAVAAPSCRHAYFWHPDNLTRSGAGMG